MSLRLKFEYYPKIESALLKDANKVIQQNKEKWDPPFFTDTKSHIDIEKIQKTTKHVINKDLRNVIVLGTGGSIQTLLALKHLAMKKIYPITSSRAVELNKCLNETNPEDSIVIPISRGGETLDVNSTIGTFLKEDYKFIGLSSMGTMNEILKKINCPILDVPDLSGRYAGSISNVGIVPAYLSGINIEDFIRGLEEGYKLYMNSENNIAIEFSCYLFNLYKKGYKLVFSMPYSKNLEGSVGLFVQCISESTGKDGKGLMGTFQSAPICQHSVLEYLLGGTKGATIPILWTINNENSDLTLESSINYIHGQTAQRIINYQADATFQALIEQSVPSVKISIDTPKEIVIGHLISFILSTIYYLCIFLDVNWANNPKVVIGKKICNKALKDKVSSEEREKIREKIADDIFRNFF
ncbi:MAG: hypothetical protein EU529_03120 [Promethearchaeota archaeon]|nr:MAG: hypothetical protein EU529_03120 [Candidatus Lokiarchaeota archaeon]